MAFLVEMFGGWYGSPGYRNFSCHGALWPKLLDAARAAGWQPMGTCLTPGWKEMQDLVSGTLGADARYPNSPPTTSRRVDLARALWRRQLRRKGLPLSDYNPPDDYGQGKYVCGPDARHLANKLTVLALLIDCGDPDWRHLTEEVRPALIREGMTARELQLANSRATSDYLIEMVRFLDKGGFGFWWDS